MDLLQIKFWEADDYRPGTKGHERRCSWGGSSCASPAEFTVTDRAGAHNGACAVHVVDYIRDRLRHGR
ncbi:hypothetical protein [Microbispora catharanthi]|uniref:Uncharacterized protein n=2 Tax=Microbispora TaxID=2005 RepID=A0A5N6BPU9_9ACTN|nr:hypothetical protein [Microbispora catharanthi]KAB8182555.1 hypothetical protein FH610_024395 [Microbispora catharanthi]